MTELGKTARLKRDAILAIKLLLAVLLAFYLYQIYFEAGPILVAAVLLIIACQIRPNLFERILRRFGSLALRPQLSVALVGLFALIVCAAQSLHRGLPEPRIHDEFSVLLAADTFLHGRLANESHPMWIHFETMHVIFQPTYASKFPPAQGLLLAAGRLVVGHPIVGVWLSTALACSAICWMLIPWVGRRWALLGGSIAGVHPMLLEWNLTYWGAALAVVGGALLLGGFRRIMRRPRPKDAWLMGFGMLVLAFSRPYEGAILSSLMVVILIAVCVRGRKQPLGLWLSRIGVPLILVVGVTVAAWGYYNLRVTGNALQMPIMLHEKTYAAAQTFLWLEANPEPYYRHDVIREFQMEWSLAPFLAQRASLAGFLSGAVGKLMVYSQALFQGWEPILLIALFFVRRDRWIRIMLAMVILATLALLGSTWARSHYAAPLTGLVFALSLRTMRRLSLLKPADVAVGAVFTRVCLILFVASLLTTDLRLPGPSPSDWSFDRARILADLRRDPHKDLVVVHYAAGHSPHEEWVYNDADIDGSDVVWARDMGPEHNRELLDYFRDRRVWLLEADRRDPTVVRYDDKIDTSPASALGSRGGSLSESSHPGHPAGSR
jgi:hypothetical protein